jgi:hypothetical protein
LSNTNNIDTNALLDLLKKLQSPETIFAENRSLFSTFIKLSLPAQVYYCSESTCPGHQLEGELLTLAQSRLFSCYLNGNGFSIAKAATIYIKDDEVSLDPLKGGQALDLTAMWRAFFQLTPLCPGATPVVASEYKGKFTVKTRPQGDTDGDDGQSKESGKKSDKKDGRRKA